MILHGKTVIVTGVGVGLGRQCVKEHLLVNAGEVSR